RAAVRGRGPDGRGRRLGPEGPRGPPGTGDPAEDSEIAGAGQGREAGRVKGGEGRVKCEKPTRCNGWAFSRAPLFTLHPPRHSSGVCSGSLTVKVDPLPTTL